MKLKSQKKNNAIIIAVIALAVIAVIAIAAVIISTVSKNNEIKKGLEIDRIMVSTPSYKTEYFVGEEFDPTGAMVQVITKDTANNHFVDYTQLSFSGFDSSVVNDAVVITVSYKGHTTTFNVKIKDHPSANPTPASIELVNFKTTYTMAEWNSKGPSSRGVTINCTYSDGSVMQGRELKDNMIYGYKKVDAPSTVELTIKVNYAGTVIEKVVTITITE